MHRSEESDVDILNIPDPLVAKEVLNNAACPDHMERYFVHVACIIPQRYPMQSWC